MNPNHESQPVTPAKREPGWYYVIWNNTRRDRDQAKWTGEKWVAIDCEEGFVIFPHNEQKHFAEIGPRIPDEPASEGREQIIGGFEQAECQCGYMYMTAWAICTKCGRKHPLSAPGPSEEKR